MKEPSTKEIIWRGIFFTIGVFLLALNYNLFLVPNNIVVGGVSGLAIIFEHFTHIDSKIFIYVVSILLLIVSFIFLGFDKTKNTIVGTLLYPIMITLTVPIAKVINANLVVEEQLLLVLLIGIVYGVSNGLIYRTEFTTGGADVIMQLMNKYLKMKESKASFIINLVVLLIGGVTFGLLKVVYAIIILYIATIIIDKIVIGISESKVFYIYTRQTNKVTKLLTDAIKTGYTILPTVGGYSHKKGEMIMVVLPTREYIRLKELVLEVDPTAFLVINDCYEVNGGIQTKNLPFI